MFIAGAMVSNLAGSFITKNYGRTWPLIVSSIWSCAFNIGNLFTTTVVSFCILRFLTGLGIGLASFVVPLYLSENIHPDNLGPIIGYFPIGLVGGIFVSYLIGVAGAKINKNLSENDQFI
eukprot:UN26451